MVLLGPARETQTGVELAIAIVAPYGAANTVVNLTPPATLPATGCTAILTQGATQRPCTAIQTSGGGDIRLVFAGATTAAGQLTLPENDPVLAAWLGGPVAPGVWTIASSA